MAIKRRERILEVSRELFNALGEANVSSLDIANELDISPGNLYYHFRGKERIIDVLVERLESELSGLTGQLRESDARIQACWPVFYPVVGCLYRYRFLLRNVNDVVYRYPSGGERLVRLVDGLFKVIMALITRLAEAGQIGIQEEQKNLIAKTAKNIMFILIYSESYQVLTGGALPEREFTQEVTLQMLSLLAPYLGEDQIRDIHQLHQAYLREKTLDSFVPDGTV